MSEVSMPPSWAPIWLACKACGHKWDDWQPSMVRFNTAIAHMKAYRCPKCDEGYRSIVIRMQPLEEDAA